MSSPSVYFTVEGKDRSLLLLPLLSLPALSLPGGAGSPELPGLPAGLSAETRAPAERAAAP